MINCTICPRHCAVDREQQAGFCGVKGSLVKIAGAFLHTWEEPCISGSRGSGTVFFSGCNLQCVYCQNHHISQEYFGSEVSVERLVEIFFELKEKGAHNINLVSATQYLPQVAKALENAKNKGLNVPVVYNCNAYEELSSLKRLEGLVDIYLPDLKYFEEETGKKFSHVSGYFATASAAVLEMFLQVGPSRFDEEGLLRSGLIIRHLVLPGHTGETKKILDWIRRNLPADVYVSLMCQYVPMYKARQFSEINRRITRKEYDKVIDYFFKIGLVNGYIQERDSASQEYTPDFDLRGVLPLGSEPQNP